MTEPSPEADAQAARLAGLARGFDWSLDEARAIGEQLRSTHAGLERARVRFGEPGDEPATTFEADG